MAKDPAFLFYPGDWIVGTSFLTMEERGQYITLLALMHQHGRLTQERVGLIVGSVSVSLKKKFSVDENGMWFNERLEEEIKKRGKFIDKQTVNGKKGGRPKTQIKPNYKPKNNPTENENINEVEIKNWDSIKLNFLNDFRWKEKFCRDKNLQMPELEKRMTEFINDIELREDFKELKELKSHFTNTFNKQKNGHTTFTASGKHKGAMQLVASLKQDFAARGKENT